MLPLDPSQLTAILERFHTVAVRVLPERCLNRRHKESGCTLCLACPTGAVTAAGTSVQVNPEACVGCGLCASVCPTEAFMVGGPALADLVRMAAEWRGRQLEAACPQRSALNETSTEADAVVRLPCLAWLSPALMVALLANGVTRLWLDDSHCSQCPLGTVNEAIVRAVRDAEALLEPFGRERAIVLASLHRAATATKRHVPVLDARQPTYSRRDLFGALRRAAAQTAVAVMDQALPPTPSRSLEPHLPAQRALLTTALSRLGTAAALPNVVVDLPLGQVVVGDECTACGLCAKLCPTGALGVVQDEKWYTVDFRATRCLGEACRLCRLICPVKAVTMSLRTPLADLLREVPTVMRSGELVPCSGCGAPTARRGDEAVCHACQWARRLRAGGENEMAGNA